MQPETRHARNGELNIAHQVGSGGPLDLVLVSGFTSHLERLDRLDDRAAHAVGDLAREGGLSLLEAGRLETALVPRAKHC